MPQCFTNFGNGALEPVADEVEPQLGGARPGPGFLKALALQQSPDLSKEIHQKLAATRDLKRGSARIPDAEFPHPD